MFFRLDFLIISDLFQTKPPDYINGKYDIFWLKWMKFPLSAPRNSVEKSP